MERHHTSECLSSLYKIVGNGFNVGEYKPNKVYINPKYINHRGIITNGGKINTELTIKVNEPPLNKTYYTSDNVPYLIVPYARILIKRIV